MSKNATKRIANALSVPDAFDLIESVETVLAKTTPLGATTIDVEEMASGLWLASKFFDLEKRARHLFREIEAELGLDQAKQIFGGLVTSDVPRSKRRVEECNNILLLTHYIECRLPMQQFARQLANGDEIHTAPFGLRYRNGTAEATEQQLKRLLKKDPTKEDSALMRLLLADARRVHQELGLKPGRPRSRK